MSTDQGRAEPAGRSVSAGDVCSALPHGDLLVVDVHPSDSAGFAPHVHDHHQLVWPRAGVLHVEAAGRCWSLPSTLAAWIPAGVEHAVRVRRGEAVSSAYVQPWVRPRSGGSTAQRRPAWDEPTIVAVRPLLRELLDHLTRPELTATARASAEAVVLDVLEPADIHRIDLPLPRDGRAVEVARRLLADPSSAKQLEHWAAEVGASVRTLSRLFARETGMPFSQWRAQVRLQAALVPLSDGCSVAAAARQVGYESAPGFVAAFRKATGQTPGAFVAGVRRSTSERGTERRDELGQPVGDAEGGGEPQRQGGR